MKKLMIIIALMLITCLLAAQARPRNDRAPNTTEDTATPTPTQETPSPRSTRDTQVTPSTTEPSTTTTPPPTTTTPPATTTTPPATTQPTTTTTPTATAPQEPAAVVRNPRTHHLSLEGTWYTPNEKLDYLLGVNGEYYYPIDKLSFIVNLGLKYGKTSITEVEDSQHQIIGESETELGSITSIYVPILLGLRLKYPIGEFQPFVGASFGLGLAVQNVFQASVEDIDGNTLRGFDDWRPYFGINWQAQLGVEYEISPDWVAYARYYYNGSKLSRYTEKDPDNPDIIQPRSNFDYSGQGVSIGIRFKLNI